MSQVQVRSYDCSTSFSHEHQFQAEASQGNEFAGRGPFLQHLCNEIKVKMLECRSKNPIIDANFQNHRGQHGTGKVHRFGGSLDSKEKHGIAVGVYVLLLSPTFKVQCLQQSPNPKFFAEARTKLMGATFTWKMAAHMCAHVLESKLQPLIQHLSDSATNSSCNKGSLLSFIILILPQCSQWLK